MHAHRHANRPMQPNFKIYVAVLGSVARKAVLTEYKTTTHSTLAPYEVYTSL